MENASDVAVIGAGPCGSFTALHLAKRGTNVAVFEEHDEIGVPCHCAGHLSITGLKRLGLYPLPEGIVENMFKAATFHSPHGREFTVRFRTPVTCAVNRALFDQYIARRAEKAGALFFLGSRVESLTVDSGFVKGVVAGRRSGVLRWSARIVVDAEGISARLSRQAGLSPPNRTMILNGVEAEVENVRNIQEDTVEVFLGREYAPGFFAWLIPKSGGKAKVGLAAEKANPKELLNKLVNQHPKASGKLRQARILQITYHPVTLGGLIPEACGNGFLAVGDVASQVKPTTGGGVTVGLTCGEIAARVAWWALCRNDFSSDFLREYLRRCKTIFGFDMQVMLRARKVFNALSDERVDDMIGFCTRYGVDRVLDRVEDIDFQGHSLLGLLPHPEMLVFILYLLYAGIATKI